MSEHWLEQESVGTSPQRQKVGPRTGWLLRGVDLLLSAVAMILLGLPLMLAGLKGRLTRQVCIGQEGRRFERLGLSLPDRGPGRLLGALGASGWPVLINILRGDMAWVGPRARVPGEAPAPALLAVRPGLVNPWYLRRRTAVDFGSEAESDARYLAQRGLRHDLGLLLRGLLVALLPLQSARSAPVDGRIQVGDVAFDNVSMNEALTRLEQMLDGPAPQQVSFVNPYCVNVAARQRGYRRVLARAGLVLPDGIGIKIGSELLGTPLKQNVNGTDLFPRLCALMAQRAGSIFLLGGQPGVAERVAAQIQERWPALRIAGLRDGFFEVAQEGEVARQVRDSGADLLLVARGVPMQDLFIDRYLPMLGVKVAMGVGGLFDFVSGRIRRAPLWMRETGLEWTYRLAQEPRRMWRRYLLGNASFLARMLLQRIGLRRPAADALPLPRNPAAPAEGSGNAVVLFATELAGLDLPVPADHPAALLPLGHATLIERIMAQLAQANLRELHLVTSDRPEQIRECLSDGGRWGIRIHWHLAKDPLRPYDVLGMSALQGLRRVLIGHAGQWLAGTTLRQLLVSDSLPMLGAAEGRLHWSGWAALAPRHLQALRLDCDRNGLFALLRGIGQVASLADGFDFTGTGAAERLLNAQFECDVDVDGAGRTPVVPPSWIRREWGAMSPLAWVADGALIQGPVLIGPGCVVQSGAVIGPRVVLSRDVLVSPATSLQRCLVLPRTYLGNGLELSDSIVNGSRVRHVRLDVELMLPREDAVLLQLDAEATDRPTLVGRAAASLLLGLCGPALLLHRLAVQLQWQIPAWTLQLVVVGRETDSQNLRLARLRCARPGAGAGQRALAAMAGLMDLVAGRRCWLGARPRDASDWYALNPEWQNILAATPVGLLHEPAWTDLAATHAEAGAAADVFHAVNRRRVGLLRAALRCLRCLRGMVGASPAPRSPQDLSLKA